MNIMEILRNPLVKTAGIVAVLYFALFSNKENPDSLGNRLSPENVKENLKEVTQKVQIIAGGISSANEQTQEVEKEKRKKFNEASTDYKDLKIGEGKEVSCGDHAVIFYRILNSNNGEFGKENTQLFIGSQKNLMLEKNVIGMKTGGTRLITLTEHSNITDSQLKSLVMQNGGRMSFEVTLENFDRLPTPPSSCK